MCGKKFAAPSLIVALALASVLVLLWLLGGPQLIQAAASTRYVATTGNDSSNGCTNNSNPCRTVQYAVDQAASGDAILVATGVYTGVHVRSRPPGYEASLSLKTITQVVSSLRSSLSEEAIRPLSQSRLTPWQIRLR
jgi:hypothetical protein